MLKAGMRVSGVDRYNNCHLSTIYRLRDRYQATWTVKYQRRFGQTRMTIDDKTETYVDRVLTIFTSTISIPVGYYQCQTYSRAPRVICF